MFRQIRLINRTKALNYCTIPSCKPKLYTSTVLLPKTKFPLKLEGKKLIERDENLSNSDRFKNLYTWQRSHLNEPEFILHDGPPYANGAPHMGHAINKILKDVILRSKIVNGIKVHYTPGWDCHGLPIELKALSTNSEKLSPLEIRAKARKYARKTIEKQKDVFESWGLIGDWKNPYTTYSPDYIKNQLKQFYKLFKKGLVYRDYKPIYWSPSSRTALAEAELEYNESHKSTSVYLRLRIQDIPNIPSLNSKRVYAVIWTTTPWSLPANQAVCYNETMSYCLVKKPDPLDTDIYIIATDLLDDLSKNLNCDLQLLSVLTGNDLQGSTYFHPVYPEKTCKFLKSLHVSSDKGTGLVHTAPAHGPEDFLVALNNKIPVVDLVNDFGCYNAEAGNDLQDKYVLKEGMETVLKLVERDIMKRGEFVHSYPYDWRTKQPVIIRASQQWFIDTNSLKNRAVELLNDVEILPKPNSEIYKNNLVRQLMKRPYWCISRQRKWGVPIPVFYDKTTGNAILTEDLINNYCNLLETQGLDFWWKLPNEQLLPVHSRGELCLSNMEKSEDILDIWFDSGISWSKVLDGVKVADMYLEGVDQFNGWFQSSLMTSVALRDKAPYKTIYVHGFAVDEQGAKMSKSLENVVDPVEVVRGKKPYGVDALRWWVACHANQDSIAYVGDNVLQSSADEVQKIRSVIRFALGSLAAYKPAEDDAQNLLLIDKYMLHLLYNFHKQARQSLDDYHFQRLGISLQYLLTNSVSALYYTAIKDRLYCDLVDGAPRRAAQYVLWQIFETITQLIAPIVPHLVEEMWMSLSEQDKSYFCCKHDSPSNHWNNETVAKIMDVILEAKKIIHKEAGASTTGMVADVSLPPQQLTLLKSEVDLRNFEDELVDILQVSKVNLVENKELLGDVKVMLRKSEMFSCPRCRRVHAEKADVLCNRCDNIVNKVLVEIKAVSN